LQSHAKQAPQATQHLGNILRARGAVSALPNQASTLLREQARAIEMALPLIGATGTNIGNLTDALRQRGAARVGA
jgi:hypothetical protein